VAVPITFTCSCGERLQVPAGTVGRMAFCLKCRRSVPIPGAVGAQSARQAGTEAKSGGEEGGRPAKPAAGSGVTNNVLRVTGTAEGGGAAEANGQEAQCVLVHGEDGQDYWRVICSCGKHVRTPVAVGRPYGRCPKCGQMLKMPGYLGSQKPVGAPARTAAGSVPVAPAREKVPDGGVAAPAQKSGEDESETAAFGVAPVNERMSREAANVAADRLRPSHAGAGRSGAEIEGKISAWPLAGKGARILATFIDLTIAAVLAGVIVVLARKQILPRMFLSKEMVVVVLVLALTLTDGLVHILLDASIGKKLAVLTTRTGSGEPMGRARAILRALLKWLLFPGWLIGLVDPSGRTLHDLLCNTLVLRGRVKHRRVQRN